MGFRVNKGFGIFGVVCKNNGFKAEYILSFSGN